MNIENSTLTVQSSGSLTDYGELQVGEQIGYGYGQVVYELLGKNTGTVLKTLREASHEELFQTHFQDISNVDFYYTVLETLQKIGIVLPNQWDVIDIRTESREEIAFIQTEINDIIMRSGTFVTLPSNLKEEPHLMPPSIKMFSTNKNGEDVFIDWDEALKGATKAIVRDIITREDLNRLREYGKKYEGYMDS